MIPFASALRCSKFRGPPVVSGSPREPRYGLLLDESGLLLELDESGEELLPLLDPDDDSAPPVADPALTPK